MADNWQTFNFDFEESQPDGDLNSAGATRDDNAAIEDGRGGACRYQQQHFARGFNARFVNRQQHGA